MPERVMLMMWRSASTPVHAECHSVSSQERGGHVCLHKPGTWEKWPGGVHTQPPGPAIAHKCQQEFTVHACMHAQAASYNICKLELRLMFCHW